MSDPEEYDHNGNPVGPGQIRDDSPWDAEWDELLDGVEP